MLCAQICDAFGAAGVPPTDVILFTWGPVCGLDMESEETVAELAQRPCILGDGRRLASVQSRSAAKAIIRVLGTPGVIAQIDIR